MLSVWRTEDASIWSEQPDTQLYAEVQMLSNKEKTLMAHDHFVQ